MILAEGLRIGPLDLRQTFEEINQVEMLVPTDSSGTAIVAARRTAESGSVAESDFVEAGFAAEFDYCAVESDSAVVAAVGFAAESDSVVDSDLSFEFVL